MRGRAETEWYSWSWWGWQTSGPPPPSLSRPEQQLREECFQSSVTNLNRNHENSVVERHELLDGKLLNVRRRGEQLPVDKVLVVRAERQELLQELLL